MPSTHSLIRFALAAAVLTVAASLAVAQTPAPLALQSASVTIAGTTNVHDYTASTTSVRLTGARLAVTPNGAAFWDDVLKTGAVEMVAVAVSAGSLASPKHDLDDNLHKALKVREYPDIVFTLRSLDAENAAGQARGTLRIAGVERDVTLDVALRRTDSTLRVTGKLNLVMTDYGITPPKAMLGMLKTDPKVTIAFEAVLAPAATH